MWMSANIQGTAEGVGIDPKRSRVGSVRTEPSVTLIVPQTGHCHLVNYNERALGVSAEFWMRLQATWDVWHVEHDRALAKKFAKIKPVPRTGAPLAL